MTIKAEIAFAQQLACEVWSTLKRSLSTRFAATKVAAPHTTWTDERWFAHVNASLVPDPEESFD